MFSDTGPFVCESANNNKALVIKSATKGGIVCQIRVDHKSAYIQGEDVLITTPENRTVIYSVRGSYKRML